MPAICCSTMRVLTRTREDLLADPERLAEIGDLSGWKPTVEWMPHVGAFCIGHTAIFYCPWCGVQLPDKHEEAEAEIRKTGIYVSVSPSGEVCAEVAGEVVDAEELMASLRAATKDQD